MRQWNLLAEPSFSTSLSAMNTVGASATKYKIKMKFDRLSAKSLVEIECFLITDDDILMMPWMADEICALAAASYNEPLLISFHDILTKLSRCV